MKKYGYPEFEKHKKEHDKLTQEVTALKAEFAAGRTAMISKTGFFLKDWLVNHILKSDKAYAPFFQSKGLR